jgi:hypothetical protein
MCRGGGKIPFPPELPNEAVGVTQVPTLNYQIQLQILLYMTPPSFSLNNEVIEILKGHLPEFRDANKKLRRNIIASCAKDTTPADSRPLEATKHRKVSPPFNGFCKWPT